jgi:hypothetical protein
MTPLFQILGILLLVAFLAKRAKTIAKGAGIPGAAVTLALGLAVR